MDVHLYLPDQLGALAKRERLPLSRILRRAVAEELQARGHTVRDDEATRVLIEAGRRLQDND